MSTIKYGINISSGELHLYCDKCDEKCFTRDENDYNPNWEYHPNIAWWTPNKENIYCGNCVVQFMKTRPVSTNNDLPADRSEFQGYRSEYDANEHGDQHFKITYKHYFTVTSKMLLILNTDFKESLIALGREKLSIAGPNKKGRDVLYDNKKLTINLDGKYLSTNGIQRDRYGKYQLIIESTEYISYINHIIKILNKKYNISINYCRDNIRAKINSDTKFIEHRGNKKYSKDDLDGKTIEGFVEVDLNEINLDKINKDNDKLIIYLNTIEITKIENRREKEKYDINKATLAD